MSEMAINFHELSGRKSNKICFSLLFHVSFHSPWPEAWGVLLTPDPAKQRCVADPRRFSHR